MLLSRTDEIYVPNIYSVTTYITSNKKIHIITIMDWIEISLHEFVNTATYEDDDQLVFVIPTQVLRLRRIIPHELGFVHGDFHGANVLQKDTA